MKSKRKNRTPNSLLNSRKGTVLVLAAALMFGLFSFLAFSIDIGYIAQSKAEMQRTADAAAMAGCWELHSQLTEGVEGAGAHPAVRTVAANYAASNPVNLRSPILDSGSTSQDVEIGYMSSPQSSTVSSDDSNPYYAVKAIVTKNQNKNGQVPFFFARIFGQSGQDMQVEATAVMSRNIQGFKLPGGTNATLDVLPFALDEDTWNDLLAGNADDDYAYDAEDDTVDCGSDGILEVNLYPQGTGSPGNRGTVDIGGSNNSTNDIKRQILTGISDQDLIDLGKPLLLDGSGTMTLNGDTGISAAVKTQLSSIIGEKRIIPIFSSVSGNGNNANYTIVKWVGVRILDVKLTGAMSKKKLIVQPAHVVSPYTVTGTTGSSYSDFVLSSVILAR